MDEGDTADITVNVDPIADRDIAVTVTMTGTGATLSRLTDGMLTIDRGENSGNLTISGNQDDDDAMNDEVILALSTDDDGVSVGSPSTTTATVIDDEVPNFPPAFDAITVDRSIPEDSLVGIPWRSPLPPLIPKATR